MVENYDVDGVQLDYIRYRVKILMTIFRMVFTTTDFPATIGEETILHL
jgi:hypothetical protein